MANLDTLSITKLVQVYNAVADKPVKTFKDKPTAVARVQAVLDATNREIDVDKNGAWIITNKPVVEPKTDKRRAAADHRVVTSVVDNPKRGKGAARFALYVVGQTVDQYIAACVAAGYPSTLARADVRWDLDHEFITVQEPAA